MKFIMDYWSKFVTSQLNIGPEGEAVHILAGDCVGVSLFDKIHALGLGLSLGLDHRNTHQPDHLFGVIQHNFGDLDIPLLELSNKENQ